MCLLCGPRHSVEGEEEEEEDGEMRREEEGAAEDEQEDDGRCVPAHRAERVRADMRDDACVVDDRTRDRTERCGLCAVCWATEACLCLACAGVCACMHAADVHTCLVATWTGTWTWRGQMLPRWRTSSAERLTWRSAREPACVTAALLQPACVSPRHAPAGIMVGRGVVEWRSEHPSHGWDGVMLKRDTLRAWPLAWVWN